MVLTILTYIITVFLILLWAYASLSKLRNVPKFRNAMLSQVFPKWIGQILTIFLPVSELAIIGLLVFPSTRLMGMYLSFVLMTAFTLYVGGAVFQIYDRYPCACGGLFSRMGWKRHFKVNILLTFIALVGVVLMEFGFK